MLMLFKILLILLLTTNAYAGLPPTRILDEGVDKGIALKFDCVGAGVTCSQSGVTGTLTITGGGAGLATTDIDTSAKLDAIVTDNTGSGALVFNNAPTMTSLVVETSLDIAATANMGADDIAIKPGITVSVCADDAVGADTCDQNCDATADDVQIQAAIDSLDGVGGTVWLSDGDFQISATITITDGIQLRGNGLSATVGVGTSLTMTSAGDFNMFEFDNTDALSISYGVVFENFTARGSKVTGGNGGFFYSYAGAGTSELHDATIRNVFISLFGDPEDIGGIANQAVVHIEPPWGFRADRLIIENSDGDGLYLGSTSNESSGAIVANSKILVNGGSAIVLDDADRCLIGNSELGGANEGKYVITTQDTQGGNGADTNVISNNLIVGENGTNGLIDICATCTANIIDGNSFSGATYAVDGIRIATGAVSNIVTDNVLLFVVGSERIDNGTTTVWANNRGEDATTNVNYIPHKIVADGLAVRPPTTFTVCSSTANALGNVTCDQVCNGTNDHIEIQAAIDALTGRMGTIYLTEGQFNIAATVTVDHGGISIVGSGTDSTLLVLVSGTNANMIELDVDTDDEWFMLRDMTLNGNRDNNTSGSGLFSGAGTASIRDVYVTNVFFSEFDDHGIHLDSAWGANITESVVEFCDGNGIQVDGSASLNTDAKITNNKIIENDGHGIQTASGTGLLTIANNLLEGGANSCGVYLDGSKSSVVNNVFRDSTETNNKAICVIGDENNITDNVINGVADMLMGIDLDSGADKNYLTGNIITESIAMTNEILNDGDSNNIIGRQNSQAGVGNIMIRPDNDLILGGTSGAGSTNENIVFDFNSAANVITVSSTTGASTFKWLSMQHQFFDDIMMTIGTGFDSRFYWNTTGADHLTFATDAGSTAKSGYFVFKDDDNKNDVDHSPATFSVNPAIRIYSADGTSATDYIEMYHDQTDGNIVTGGGNLNITPAGGGTTITGMLGVGTVPARTLHIDEGTGWGTVAVDGSSGGCLMMKDTDDAGWTECSVLNGTMTCTTDADAVCDGS